MVSLWALLPLKVGAGLRGVKERGGGYGRGVKAWTWHVYARSWAAGMAESDGNWWRRCRAQWHGRRKRELICGAHMLVTGKREGDVAQRNEPKKEIYSDEDAMGTQDCWARWVRRWPVGSGGPTWGGLGWIPGGDSNGVDFQISNEFRMWWIFEEFYRKI
jgi:hypothetical protein